MQRNPIIANIYGYAVCLIAVLVFFAGTAGFVGSAFNVVHPTPDHAFMSRQIRVGSMPDQGFRMGWQSHGKGREQLGPGPGGPMLAPPFPPNASFAAAHAGGRVEALRRLLVSLALLILAGVLFARHWYWLNGEHASS